MVHSIGYLGRFERDFEKIGPQFREYEKADGSCGEVNVRPLDLDGVFFGYMECTGRNFVAVRAQYGEHDVFLRNPVRLVPKEHTDGKGFGPKPATFGDQSARRLLVDMIARNADQADEIKKLAGDLYLHQPSVPP